MLVLSGCATARVDSYWRDREIAIDGANNEWQDMKTYFMKKKVAIALLNDNEYLYFHLVSWDSSVRTLLRGGITVWFVQDKEKSGVRYPAGPGRMMIGRRVMGL